MPSASTTTHPSDMDTGPSAREALKKVEEAFAKIGTDKMPTTLVPSGSKNTSEAAAEYATAKHLAQLAAERLKAAEARAYAEGVLRNRDELEEGMATVVWTSGSFDVTQKRARNGLQLDKDKLLETLSNAPGIGAARAGRLIADSQSLRQGAVTITVALKG